MPAQTAFQAGNTAETGVVNANVRTWSLMIVYGYDSSAGQSLSQMTGQGRDVALWFTR